MPTEAERPCRGHDEVARMFDNYASTRLAEPDRFIYKANKTVLVAARGSDLFSDYADFVCDQPEGVTVAVAPTERVPLVVFTLKCSDAMIGERGNFCVIQPNHTFDTLLTDGNFDCDVWKWSDTRWFRTDFIFPLGWHKDNSQDRFRLSDAEAQRILTQPSAMALFRAPDLK